MSEPYGSNPVMGGRGGGEGDRSPSEREFDQQLEDSEQRKSGLFLEQKPDS